jgi:diguanylate cyclase (GGDEF)-like protein
MRDVGTGASVPLRRTDSGPVDGALSVGFNGERWIGAADVELLEAFADLAGVAVRNAEAHAVAQRAATMDSLTGCANRTAFETRLREEISRAERDGTGFTLALIDLDDFKSINEEHGHLAGDTVLRAVGEILRGALRLHDTAARVGGDEFALLLPGTSAAAAEPVVDRSLRELRRAPLPGGGLLGAAAGVASWRPGEQSTTLIERADVALREAKHDPVHPTRRIEALEPGGADRESAVRRGGPGRLADAVAVGAKLSRLLDVRAIAEVAVQELNETLGYERCMVARLHESGRVSPVALAGGSWDAAVRWSRPQDEGAVGRCLRERRPVLVDDAARDPQFSGGVVAGMRSQLAMPLYTGADLWGALDLQAREPGSFTTEDAQIVGTVADHVGAALRTAALYTQLEQTYQGTAEALAAALEAKDNYTADHARSIADLAVEVGNQLDLPADTLRDVRYGAIFHDIGKIAIPDAILNKPGELSPDEFEVVKLHPVTGEQILAPVPFLADVRRIVRHDHERWDGTGYPDGLRGSQIPIGARIVFVVDAYHAMTSDRPYRLGMGDPAARAELRAGAGTQFDPDVVDALLAVLDRRTSVVA